MYRAAYYYNNKHIGSFFVDTDNARFVLAAARKQVPCLVRALQTIQPNVKIVPESIELRVSIFDPQLTLFDLTPYTENANS